MYIYTQKKPQKLFKENTEQQCVKLEESHRKSDKWDYLTGNFT